MRKLLILLFISFSVGLLSQDTLVVGYAEAPPFILNSDNGPTGVNIWLWQKIAEDLDINYELRPMSFGQMMDALSDHSIDISINPLTLTAERSRSMYFTSPFFVSNSTAVVRESNFNQLAIFLRTFFSREFLAGLLLLLLIIFIFGILTWWFERKSNPEQFRSSARGLWDGFWWSAVTLTTVGYGDKAPQSKGGKIIALILMFTALLFISGLTASIASTILASQQQNHPTNFNDLREQNVGTIASTGTANYLKSRFFKQIVEFDDVNDGLIALSKEEIDAFIYDEPILRYRLKEHPEFEMTILPLKFYLQLYGFAVSPKNKALLPSLSERILHYTSSLEWPIILQENGLEAI